mmetsp:Transcript_30104/g.65691  ORF Transcript_30104/g.65691 Transcript_30104/m.65691 type:complete len:378 (-) Transcript_30104:81-1214(-)
MAGPKLFVGCLPYSKTEADLTPVFAKFGQIAEVALLRGPDGNSKGAAFVTFQHPASASNAMTFLQNYVFPGASRGINLSYATSTGGSSSGSSGAGAPKIMLPSKAASKGAGKAPVNSWSHQEPVNSWQQATHQPAVYGQPPPPPGAPPGAPGTKLFVGQLPYSKSDADLWQLFSSVGHVTEVVVLKDQKTGQKKGAAFVKYTTADAANQAIAVLDGFVFTGATRPITVALAQGQGDGFPEAVPTSSASTKRPSGGMGMSMEDPAETLLRMGQPAEGQYETVYLSAEAVEGAKLFVGQLPFSRSEDDIMQVFSQFGPVCEVHLHRDAQGQKKGAAFVRFMTSEHAVQALALDGYLFEGSTRPITVAFASEGAKRQRLS